MPVYNSSPTALTNFVTPVFAGFPTTAATTVTANRIYIWRFVMPKSGTLSGVCAWIATSSGNIDVGVYDTGDALAGSRSKLYSSGAIACPANGGLKELANPNLAVTAGQHVDIAIVFDNALAVFGRYTPSNSPLGSVLPAGYMDAPGGATTKLVGIYDSGASTLPATIAEASIANSGTNMVVWLCAKVS